MPSQQTDDSSPAAIVVREDGEEEDHLEWLVQGITDERIRNGELQYLVIWMGYLEGSWEPATALKDTKALDEWLAQTSSVRKPNGRLQNS